MKNSFFLITVLAFLAGFTMSCGGGTVNGNTADITSPIADLPSEPASESLYGTWNLSVVAESVRSRQ